MIEVVDGRMTIGAFSARCGLSTKVLRTYAEAGLLMPSAVDPASGYRYYEAHQLEEAALVVLLRRAGISVADIVRFLAQPSSEMLEGWRRSLIAEVQARRRALADIAARLDLTLDAVVEIRPVADRAELRRTFDLLGAQLASPLTAGDFRFRDLDTRFEEDRCLMLVAVADGRPVGGALGFRDGSGSAVFRIMAVVESFRLRGTGRRLVERFEAEALRLRAETVALGTDDAISFYVHLGYTPNLIIQWVYDADLHDAESLALIEGPLAGLRHWRSSFNDVPQLFIALDEPRLDLRESVREAVTGCHVGFMLCKRLQAA